MESLEKIGPELPGATSEVMMLREQIKRYESEIMRLRGLADELSWALSKAVLMSGAPKGQ